ncbi:MAG TPA: phosphatase PAP2 family protein [Candidatus Eisenbacteria bacterium]|nr:phosphatase PAP2 family protein [Candidatus Eisenbacteria bacterium]
MGTEPKGVLVALNAGAPRYPPEEVRATLQAAATERGVPCEFVTLPRGPDIPPFLDREFDRMAKQGLSRVVAAGGDGTIGAVAGAIAHRAAGNDPLEMGIIASGTANVLAGELGIPAALAEAAAIAIGSEATIPVDAIEIAGRHVLTQVGIGPDAAMIRDTSHGRRERLGRLAYVLTFLRRAIQHPSRKFNLTIDGDRVPATAWQIVVANAGTLGMPPFTWGPRIDSTDGILDICIYDVRGLRDVLPLFLRVALERHRPGGSTRFFRAHEEVVIECEVPALVQGDGEILGRTPVRLRLVPKAVSVVVARTLEPMQRDAPPNAESAEDTPAAPSVREEVQAMMAQHSQTWFLQGPLRHPAAALGAFDAALFLRVNNLLLGTFADRVLTATSRVMHYGEGWGIVVLALVLADVKTGLRAAIEILPVLWLTMLTVNFPLKKFFRRRRPFLAFVKARVLGPRPKDFSLPSGHSAAAFAGALLLTTHVPALGPLFYAIALIVAVSRVYLGVHYPSDVVLGAAAGTLLAIAYRTLLHAVTPL